MSERYVRTALRVTILPPTRIPPLTYHHLLTGVVTHPAPINIRRLTTFPLPLSSPLSVSLPALSTQVLVPTGRGHHAASDADLGPPRDF